MSPHQNPGKRPGAIVDSPYRKLLICTTARHAPSKRRRPTRPPPGPSAFALARASSAAAPPEGPRALSLPVAAEASHDSKVNSRRRWPRRPGTCSSHDRPANRPPSRAAVGHAATTCAASQLTAPCRAPQQRRRARIGRSALPVSDTSGHDPGDARMVAYIDERSRGCGLAAPS